MITRAISHDNCVLAEISDRLTVIFYTKQESAVLILRSFEKPVVFSFTWNELEKLLTNQKE